MRKRLGLLKKHFLRVQVRHVNMRTSPEAVAPEIEEADSGRYF